MREERRATLLAVADGVGGQAGGEAASAAAVDSLVQRFFAAPTGTSASDALANAMREANDAVLARAGESGHPGAASTLVAAAITGSDAVIGNLGDSRAYLLRDGELRRITADHSGASPSSITRFVGDPRGVQPDVFVETLRSGDRLLLCSDGLTRHVADEELAPRLRGTDLQKTVNDLVDLANERGGADNVTLVLYAARGASGLAAFARAVTSIVLAILIAAVVGSAAGALLFASGALPASP